MRERKREREDEQGRGAEGEGEADSLLSKEPDVGLHPRPGPWDHDLNPRQTANRLSHASTLYHVFMHSFVGGHLGSLHSLAIVDIAAINIGVQVLLRMSIFVSSG